MPLYEYRCATCGERFELLRPMSRSSELATCPSGHRRAERVVSIFAAQVKGGDGAMTMASGGGGCGGCAGGACASCGGH